MNREVTNSSEVLEDLEVTQEFEKIKKNLKKDLGKSIFYFKKICLKKITKQEQLIKKKIGVSRQDTEKIKCHFQLRGNFT